MILALWILGRHAAISLVSGSERGASAAYDLAVTPHERRARNVRDGEGKEIDREE